MTPKICWLRHEADSAREAVCTLDFLRANPANQFVRQIRMALEENLYWARRRLSEAVTAYWLKA